MNHDQYRDALDKLGLGHAAQVTARVLGAKPRTIRHYASGSRPIPEPTALLLQMYLMHGIPHYLTAGKP